MSAQDDAFKQGMRFRRDNVSEDDVVKEFGGYTLSASVHLTSAVEGWKFMDRLILGLELMTGKA